MDTEETKKPVEETTAPAEHTVAPETTDAPVAVEPTAE